MKEANKMEIVYVAADKIKQYKNNAKIHTPQQIKQIAKSIKKFGFNDPIALDEKYCIIEGHGRYLAGTQELGMKKFPCIILRNMTQQEKRAYILAHNKLTMNTGFDEEILNLELAYLSDADFDLEITGFNEVELMEALSDIEPAGFDKSEFKDYEERANESLKSYNVIICCKTEKDKRFVSKLLREDGKLKRTYEAQELKQRFKK